MEKPNNINDMIWDDVFAKWQSNFMSKNDKGQYEKMDLFTFLKKFYYAPETMPDNIINRNKK
jgi:hypothetical protein